MRKIVITFFGALLLVGCTQPTLDQKPARKIESNASLLDKLVLTERPTETREITDVLAKGQTGEKVAVLGQLPPKQTEPFNGQRAAFLVMDPAVLKSQEVADELSCEDAATCPSCRKLLDEKALPVELVDESGATLKTSVEGYKGLQPSSQVIVLGTLERTGKVVRLKGTGIYVP